MMVAAAHDAGKNAQNKKKLKGSPKGVTVMCYGIAKQ